MSAARDYNAEAEAIANEQIVEGYLVQPDGTSGRLDSVIILDEDGEPCVSFRSPLAAIKVANRIIEIAARVNEAKVAFYDEVQALNKALYGDGTRAPLINLSDYQGGSL